MGVAENLRELESQYLNISKLEPKDVAVIVELAGKGSDKAQGVLDWCIDIVEKYDRLKGEITSETIGEPITFDEPLPHDMIGVINDPLPVIPPGADVSIQPYIDPSNSNIMLMTNISFAPDVKYSSLRRKKIGGEYIDTNNSAQDWEENTSPNIGDYQ